MKSILKKGFLLAVEGIDGAGKTTIAALLAQYCGERGLSCLLSKEPTGLSYGQQMRESAKFGRLSLEEEMDFFLKDRIEHFKRAIGPALNEGAFVILDRYYWSTAAYQGARGLCPDTICEENEKHVPKPDLILLLDVSPETGLARIHARGDTPNDFEEIKGLTRAREIFLGLHESRRHSSALLDANCSLRDAHKIAQKAFLRAVVERIAKENLTPEGVEATLELLGRITHDSMARRDSANTLH